MNIFICIGIIIVSNLITHYIRGFISEKGAVHARKGENQNNSTYDNLISLRNCAYMEYLNKFDGIILKEYENNSKIILDKTKELFSFALTEPENINERISDYLTELMSLGKEHHEILGKLKSTASFRAVASNKAKILVDELIEIIKEIWEDGTSKMNKIDVNNSIKVEEYMKNVNRLTEKFKTKQEELIEEIRQDLRRYPSN